MLLFVIMQNERVYEKLHTYQVFNVTFQQKIRFSFLSSVSLRPPTVWHSFATT